MEECYYAKSNTFPWTFVQMLQNCANYKIVQIIYSYEPPYYLPYYYVIPFLNKSFNLRMDELSPSPSTSKLSLPEATSDILKDRLKIALL